MDSRFLEIERVAILARQLGENEFAGQTTLLDNAC
jgi:hypothetical protein